jgi:hypothetical protein
MFVNLTPHPVTIFGDDDTEVTTIPTSGMVARLTETATETETGSIDGIASVAVTLGAVDGLPDPTDGVIYIVSMPLLMGMRASGNTRMDVRYPYGQVRDAEGRIMGCRSLGDIPTADHKGIVDS